MKSPIFIQGKFDQKATTPKGYRTFGIPADNNQSFKWRGYDINSNKLIIVPKSGDLEAISKPGFKVHTVSISNKWIETYRETLGTDNLNVLDNGTEVVDLNSQSMNILRHQLQYLINQIENRPQIIHKRAFQQIFIGEVPSIILKNLIFNNAILDKPVKRIRDISLDKAIDYLNACKAELPTVKELCLISGASQRTLEYAFKEKYGFGPKEYMIKHRLNKVYKIIKESDPSAVKIKDIAHNFGFWHLGQFSSDYKRLFRELPSATLRKVI